MKKSLVTIVTTKQYDYSDRYGNTRNVYYGTYPTRDGGVGICRITSSCLYELGEVIRSYLVWSAKAKQMVNITLEEDE